MMASPPNTIVSVVHASLRKDLSSTGANLSRLTCKLSLSCLRAIQSRNVATRSREETSIPNQVKGAIGSNAYRYMDTTDWRDMVRTSTQCTQAQLGLSFENVTGADRNVSLIYLCILCITYLLYHRKHRKSRKRYIKLVSQPTILSLRDA